MKKIKRMIAMLLVIVSVVVLTAVSAPLSLAEDIRIVRE